MSCVPGGGQGCQGRTGPQTGAGAPQTGAGAPQSGAGAPQGGDIPMMATTSASMWPRAMRSSPACGAQGSPSAPPKPRGGNEAPPPAWVWGEVVSYQQRKEAAEARGDTWPHGTLGWWPRVPSLPWGGPAVPPQPKTPLGRSYQVCESRRLDLAAVRAAAAVRHQVHAEFTLWGHGDRAGDTGTSGPPGIVWDKGRALGTRTGHPMGDRSPAVSPEHRRGHV